MHSPILDKATSCPRSFAAVPDAAGEIAAALARMEDAHAAEFRLETGRLVRLLAAYPSGLSKDELLERFYPNYASASARRKDSLETCMNKVLQRARPRFRPLGLDVSFNKETNSWRLVAGRTGRA